MMKKQICFLFLASIVLALVAVSCSKNDDTVSKDDGQLGIRPVTDASSAYVDTVFSFNPAPGQFVNTDFADINTAKKITENKTISLGAWGGQIVLGFDHTVLNQAGEDLLVMGNAAHNNAEPGIVWVSFDANGNGQPDDTWYELKGSAYGSAGYERNYKVTYYNPKAGDKAVDVKWEDNQGNSGFVKANTFNKQSYFPSWITEDSYTLEGSKLPDTNINTDNATLITSTPFDYGYADNIATADGGDSLDISSAMDQNGQLVQLKGIDFIMIQTGVMKDMGWLGEQSTELSSVGDLSLLK